MTVHTFFKAAFLGLATLTAAGGASAQSTTEVYTSQPGVHSEVTVKVGDLDLASPSGQETLYRRLNAATEKVCGSSRLHKVGSAKEASRNGECRRAALSRAMARINEAAVAAR